MTRRRTRAGTRRRTAPRARTVYHGKPLRYPGTFHRGQESQAIEAVGRALIQAKALRQSKLVFSRLPKRMRMGWGSRKIAALKRFKRQHHLPHDAHYGQKTHHALTPYFDAKARKLLAHHAAPPPEVHKLQAMAAAMRAVSRQTPGYNYGGEHDGSISDDLPSAAFDCSSSTSYVLNKGGMLGHTRALVSGELMNWGEPGKGKYFTVMASPTHAWIRLTSRRFFGPYWRFDTSPWGSGGSGARLRWTPRWTGGFAARHYPGM